MLRCWENAVILIWLAEGCCRESVRVKIRNGGGSHVRTRHVVFNPESNGRHWQFLEEAVTWSKSCFTDSEDWTGMVWEETCWAEAGRMPCEEERAEGVGPGPAGGSRGWGRKEKRQNLHLVWQLIGSRWIKKSSGKMATWMCPGFSWANACWSQQACQAEGMRLDGLVSGGFQGWGRISASFVWQEPGVNRESLGEASKLYLGLQR